MFNERNEHGVKTPLPRAKRPSLRPTPVKVVFPIEVRKRSFIVRRIVSGPGVPDTPHSEANSAVQWRPVTEARNIPTSLPQHRNTTGAPTRQMARPRRVIAHFLLPPLQRHADCGRPGYCQFSYRRKLTLLCVRVRLSIEALDARTRAVWRQRRGQGCSELLAIGFPRCPAPNHALRPVVAPPGQRI